MNNNPEYDRLFVGGDLSGIQKFLYNITSKKAAVSLKGRSQYLRLYMEQLCADMMSLPSVASLPHEVIYCSGGKFYAIVQNTHSIADELVTFAKQQKKKLWTNHYGHLSINISFIPFHENEDGSINVEGLQNQPLGELWKHVAEDFARQKNQKFIDQIRDDYDAFFGVKSVGGNPKVCAVTGVESEACVPFQYMDDEKSTYVLPSVKEQIMLGEKLREKEHFRTFEEYAEGTYLGILRMDVDGLGKLFANGFSSFKEYKALSSRLDAYFTSRPNEGYLSNLERIQQKPYYKEHMCIIYAGGDDVFAVGRWDKVVDFAAEVQEDFVRYVNVEGVSISGGVAIVHPKFPIAKAAELAGDAEDEAKKYIYKNVPKNAFCLFGKAISWQDEFDFVEQYKNELFELISIHNMPRGILHKIMSYASIAERNADRTNKDYSYIWHSAYYLTRVIEREKNNQMVVEFCKRLRDRELYGSEGKFRLMAIAARWAELILRMNN